MTALIIVGVILLILLVILFVPVGLDFEYSDKLRLKLSFMGITIYSLKEKKPDLKKDKKPSEKQTGSSKESGIVTDFKNRFKEIKEKEGFTAAVREGAEFVKALLGRLQRLLPHIHIKRVRLGITVASRDAAKTAVDYGIVCSAVYPVASLLWAKANVGFKEINIKSDFEATECDFTVSATVKMQIFYLLVTAVRVLTVIKNFLTEKKENERK